MTAGTPSATPPRPDLGLTATKNVSAGKTGLLAGVVLFVACAAACSLPLLLAGGAAIGVGAFFSGTGALAGVLLGVTALMGALLWLSRRRARTVEDTGGCGRNCGC
jgi:membrane protein implicated in regulation of membrane protease activity